MSPLKIHVSDLLQTRVVAKHVACPHTGAPTQKEDGSVQEKDHLCRAITACCDQCLGHHQWLPELVFPIFEISPLEAVKLRGVRGDDPCEPTIFESERERSEALRVVHVLNFNICS